MTQKNVKDYGSDCGNHGDNYSSGEISDSVSVEVTIRRPNNVSNWSPYNELPCKDEKQESRNVYAI